MIRVKQLQKDYYSFTGSKVLSSMMDNKTPGIDLLVRESIQNSGDAALRSSKFVRIDFRVGDFASQDLAKNIELIGPRLESFYHNQKCKFLSIGDKNTCGLLGSPFEDVGEAHNLYNLVYDLMNGQSEAGAGGSWGVGKSVYYRYGNGLCFYYSRTQEDGKYQEKLAGALIEDEKGPDPLLGPKQRGIALLGDIVRQEDGKERPVPIYDGEEIKKFLTIFGLEPYTGSETGTVVIIPYIEEEKLLGHAMVREDSYFWDNDLLQSLEMSIKRWYFPRIDNYSFDKMGKPYLVIGINGKKVSLDHFFQELQDLYNGELQDEESFQVVRERGYENKEPLGTLLYKVFSKDELGVEVPPENLPGPFALLDVSGEGGGNDILFYTRSPGMVITYDNERFGHYHLAEGQYLIGVFVLNSDWCVGKEKIDEYFRKTESANHKEWSDLTPNSKLGKDFPIIAARSPFSFISKKIANHLDGVFSTQQAVVVEKGNNALQRELGEKLLPPEDFGSAPSPETKPKPGDKKKNFTKNKPIKFVFNGFEGGLMSFSFEFVLEKGEAFISKLAIITSSKTYSVDEWEDLGFQIPCLLKTFSMSEYSIGAKCFPLSITRAIDASFLTPFTRKDFNCSPLFSYEGVSSSGGFIEGIRIKNLTGGILKAQATVLLEPKDLTYQASFACEKEVSNKQ